LGVEIKSSIIALCRQIILPLLKKQVSLLAESLCLELGRLLIMGIEVQSRVQAFQGQADVSGRKLFFAQLSEQKGPGRYSLLR